MSVQREKVSTDKQGFIKRVFDCFGRDLRRLQLFFLNDAGKSCWVKKDIIVVFLKTSAICFFVKKVPSTLLEKSADSLFCITCLKLPGYCCQRSAFFVTIAVKWSNLFLCRKG